MPVVHKAQKMGKIINQECDSDDYNTSDSFNYFDGLTGDEEPEEDGDREL